MPIDRNADAWLGKGFRFFLFVGGVTLLLCVGARAQTAQSKDHSDRKVVSRIEPEYPETLKRLYIGGVVRIEVTVDPSGRVASTELLGEARSSGSPG